jgi:predicted ester cyclase
MADEAVFRAPGGMSGTGKRACAEFFDGWISAFPDAHVAVRDLYVCGDVGLEEGTFEGTHDGVLHTPAGDIQPTGNRVMVDYMQAIQFRDGKQASFDLIYDRLQLLEQLGLSPMPA